jgi:hypothetical protein
MNKKSVIIGIVFVVILIIGVLVWVFKKPEERKLDIKKSELNEAKKQVKITVLRFDQDVFKVNPNHITEGFSKLAEIYPTYLVDKKVCFDTLFIQDFINFLKDPFIIDVYKRSQQLYSNFERYENSFKDGFAYYLVYFPKEKIPNIITMIRGIDVKAPSIYIYDQNVYINLDLYLGKDYVTYNKLGFPKYISERMDSTYLDVDLFKKAMVYKHLPDQRPITLMESMIIEGKKLYFTEMMLPHKPLKDIIGYSEEKYQWAEKYYPNVWAYMIEKNILFSQEDVNYRNYIEESPFTKPFGNVSPGRFGQFLGWKIVKAYMENNPEVTLSQLMQTTDLQMILNKSAFKPVVKK